MKQFCQIFLVLIVVVLQSCAERKVLFNPGNTYEIYATNVGQDGTKVFKVYSYAKTVDMAIAQAKKDAVAACVFRGIAGSNGVANTPAICPEQDAYKNHADYFNAFFADNGKYLQYVNMTTDGIPSGQDRLKVKDGYKLGLMVQVLYDKLRKDLENDGVARRLDEGF